MDNLLVEKLTKKYVEIVFELEKKLIGDCDKSSIEKSLKSDTLNYYVLIKNDKVIGFFECMILPPEIELYDIAIDESEQGKGYSKIMMDYMIKIAKDSHVHTLFLEVNSINYKAIRLYDKYGFKEYSVRKDYYGKNEDAVLMRFDLNND